MASSNAEGEAPPPPPHKNVWFNLTHWGYILPVVYIASILCMLFKIRWHLKVVLF